VSRTVVQKAQRGGVALLMKRDEGGLHAFDDLAVGLETGAISRGKAMKLGGAALMASAVGLFASRGAEAQEDVETAVNRRRCNRRGGDFCRNRGRSICCGAGGRRRRACCGRRGAACCSKNERCDNGQCKRHN
jgi:hypothetical protein